MEPCLVSRGALQWVWQSKSQLRVIYCCQKEVKISEWVLFFDRTKAFFYACLLHIMCINSQREIYFYSPLFPNTCAYPNICTQLQRFTLGITVHAEDRVVASSSLKSSFSLRFDFSLKYLSLSENSEVYENHPFFQWQI